MESQGQPGTIQITERTWRLVKDDFACQERGTIDVKGAGPVARVGVYRWERATPWRVLIVNQLPMSGTKCRAPQR